MTVEEAKRKELDELSKHNGLSFYSENLGYKNLTESLSNILALRIKNNLPHIASTIK